MQPIRRLALVGTAVALLTQQGCGSDVGSGGKRARRDTTPVDNAPAFAAINQQLEENNEARRLKFGGAGIVLVSDKVRQMKSLMDDGGCDDGGGSDQPPTDPTREWEHEYDISGPTCPIRLNIYWRAIKDDKDSRLWAMNHDFQVMGSDYRKLTSVLRWRSQGHMKAYMRGVVSTVEGEFQILELNMNGSGRHSGRILVRIDSRGNRVEGSVRLVLMRGAWFGTGKVVQRREGGRNVTEYFVDSNRIDRKRFQELFSAFRLDELLNTAMEMKK